MAKYGLHLLMLAIGVPTRRNTPIEQFVEMLDRYIRWYNEKSIKSSLGYLSPIKYRESLGLTM